MKKILIACGALKAVVLPDFGGMVAELSIGEANVLRMDYGLLGLGNVLAGGIPVLFPFASRCENDEAEFLGKRYQMPLHGFAKDQPFEVTRTWPQGCELRLEDNAATRRLYPFAFALTLAYELRETALHTTMRVENRGEVPLPFAAGFHPYFLTPCREQARCEMQMRAYWDYAHPEADGAPAQRELQGELRLSDEYDAVFFGGRPGAQQSRHAAALVVLDELTGEFLLHALALFAAGQQQKAFHLHQMRRHFNEGAGCLGIGVSLLHGAGVLVDQLQDGDIVQVHLMLGHQSQQ